MTNGIPHDLNALPESTHVQMRAPSESTELFAGTGATREAFRGHDWGASALGPQLDWPPSLRSSVLHILWSSFPNLILWGPQLLVLYNDAYLDLIGDGTLSPPGLPAREAWSRIWELVSPIHSRVIAGETLSLDDVELTITRQGREEAVRRTLSFAPVQDERGDVRGVLITVFESARVIAADAD